MGNLVADAMREAHAIDPATGLPEAEAAYTNSGGLRQDLLCTPPSGTEQTCQITQGELFSVLPFGNATVIETLTGAQMRTAFLNGFTPVCDPSFAGGTGRFPQISGLKVQFHCNGTTPVVDTIWKTPNGIAGPATVVGDADTVRFVTNDFMYTGGDGYTVFTQGTEREVHRQAPARRGRRVHRGAPAGQPGRGGAHRRSLTIIAAAHERDGPRGPSLSRFRRTIVT